MGLGGVHNNSSMTMGAGDHSMMSLKAKGKRPAARDGHTGIVFGPYFLVFGGDRHHMPFNDTFILDLKSETGK